MSSALALASQYFRRAWNMLTMLPPMEARMTRAGNHPRRSHCTKLVISVVLSGSRRISCAVEWLNARTILFREVGGWGPERQDAAVGVRRTMARAQADDGPIAPALGAGALGFTRARPAASPSRPSERREGSRGCPRAGSGPAGPKSPAMRLAPRSRRGST